MLHVATEWGVIEAVPVTIRLLKVQHKLMAFYEEAEYRRLVEGGAKADDRAHVAVLLGGEAGLRRGEMTALVWSGGTLTSGAVSCTSTGQNGKARSGPPRAGGRGRSKCPLR